MPYFPHLHDRAPVVAEGADSVYGDMMTGRLEAVTDRPSASAESTLLRLASGLVAGLAITTCLYGGPGVAAPRIGEAPAVFRMPPHPKLKR